MNTLTNSKIGFAKTRETFDAMCHLLDQDADRWRILLAKMSAEYGWGAALRLRHEAFQALLPLCDAAVILHDQLLVSQWVLDNPQKHQFHAEPEYMI